MNKTESNKLIKDLTLGFFNTINANIICTEHVYEISIPEKYCHIFKNKVFSIAFDSEIKSKTDFELIAPGSDILSSIISLCKTKGPIAKGFIKNSNLQKNSFGVRFYFYVKFDGIYSFTELDYVDLELNTAELLDIKDELLFNSEIEIEHLDFESMSSLYMKATKSIRKKFETDEQKIINSLLKEKESELTKINSEYNQMIDEVEKNIKDNENKSLSDKDTHNLYDEAMEKIHKIRNEQTTMSDTISAKYKSTLSYTLIGIVVFMY
jgi:hypothetical protein